MHWGQPSPYPLGTRTPQPPAAALLARSRGDLASLDPESGCGCSRRGCCDARVLQQQVAHGGSATTATPLACDKSARRAVGASQQSGRQSGRRHEAARVGAGGARRMAAAEAGSSSGKSAADTTVAEKNHGGSRGVRGAGDGVVEAEDEFSSRQARTGRAVAKAQVRGLRGEARGCCAGERIRHSRRVFEGLYDAFGKGSHRVLHIPTYSLNLKRSICDRGWKCKGAHARPA